MTKGFLLIAMAVIGSGCSHTPTNNIGNNETLEAETVLEKGEKCYVERIDTNGLTILYPQFKTIDLVCGTEPEKSDTSVILFAEAAYTGQLLKDFKHLNIAGYHVSSGEKHEGYKCTSNTGAFVFYNGNWKFLYQNYSYELDSAANNGGAAFAQELMIFNGEVKPTKRSDTNKNVFRALCEHRGRLCIVESRHAVSFGEFKQKLLNYGISNAIYLDMGNGWNYAWYRDGDKIIELHPKTHNYCTNWITFFK